MYIREIIIEKNRKITESLSFNKGLSMVKGSAELYDVIKLVLGKREAARCFHNLRFLAVVELDKTYYIRGRKNKGELLFDVSVCSDDSECTEEYFDIVRKAEEIDSGIFFHRFKRQDYPHKLFKYRDLLKYYPNGDFSALTNGYGTTRSFRGFMTDYIKHFKPIKLREGKELFLKLSSDGEFNVGYLGSDEKVFLSESEQVLYHYLSFISVADFWSGAEKIRNLNRVNKPLIVSNFLERLDDSIDLSEIVRRTNEIDRQVIMFSQRKGRIIKLIDEKKNLLSAIRLWAISRGMYEITDDEDYTYWTDIAFKKENKIYGFITEFDRDAEKLKFKSVFVRDFCDYAYIVTYDESKKKYIKDNTIDGMGILCYSNAFGLGMTYQVLKEPDLLY